MDPVMLSGFPGFPLNVDTRLVKGTGIIESCFPYYGSHPLFKGTRIIESFFGQGENSKKQIHKAKLY